MAYFPLMYNLVKKKCLVIGGDSYCFEKAKIFLEFGADVTVIAPEFCDSLKKLNKNRAELIQRNFVNEDIRAGYKLAYVNTGDETVDLSIAFLCRQFGLSICVHNHPQDSDYIFPEYIKESDLVCAFTTSGMSPIVDKYLKNMMLKYVNNSLVYVTERYEAKVKELQNTNYTKEEKKEILEKYFEDMMSETSVDGFENDKM